MAKEKKAPAKKKATGKNHRVPSASSLRPQPSKIVTGRSAPEPQLDLRRARLAEAHDDRAVLHVDEQPSEGAPVTGA